MTTHSPNEDLAGRILDRIKDERLSPRPRWEFIFKNYVFWSFGALAVVLGALAFSAMLFEIENAGWRFYAATHGDFVTFFLHAAPFLWVSILGLFILFGYANIRHTKRGYRYPLAVIALGAVLTSITLGTALYAAGLGSTVEESFGDHPPFYRPIIVQERAWWLAPGKGLLGGTVVSLAPDDASFSLQDFSGQVWTVDSRDLPSRDLTIVARGGTVRVIGLPMTASSSDFHACFVFPWEMFGKWRNGLPPRPLGAVSSTSERSFVAVRSEVCKGIHPYEQLRSIDGDGD